MAGLGRFFPLPIIQILAGVVLGPSIFGALAPETFRFMFRSEIAPGLSAIAGVETLANVAAVLFILLAGCKADRGIIARSAGTVLRIGMTGVFLPWLLGTLAALAIITLYPTQAVLGAQERPTLYAVAFGLCMAVSAPPVLVIVLRELGFNAKPIGTIAPAIGGLDDALLSTGLKTSFAFDDPTVWLILGVALVVCVSGKFAGITVPALLIVGGPGAGQRLSLFEGRNTIGRAEGNDLVLNFGDPAVSRDTHALITLDPQIGRMRLYDGGKTNPVHLNGEALQGNRPIRLGDIIAVGNTTLRLDRA